MSRHWQRRWRRSATLRKGIDRSDDLGDMATADWFAKIVRRADTDLWFLEAHRQG
jgi:DNA-binding ferritin-like protein